MLSHATLLRYVVTLRCYVTLLRYVVKLRCYVTLLRCYVVTLFYFNTNHDVFSNLKPAVDRMFLASLGKNSIITFQHIVIQVFWEKTRLLLLLMALFSGFKKSSPWRETLTNHRSFQRESVPIGCSFNGGSCQSLANSDQTVKLGSADQIWINILLLYNTYFSPQMFSESSCSVLFSCKMRKFAPAGGRCLIFLQQISTWLTIFFLFDLTV